MSSKTLDDMPSLVANCYRLNSAQVRHLLHRYKPDANEAPPTQTFINNMVEVHDYNWLLFLFN
jgi:hypothetical protein